MKISFESRLLLMSPWAAKRICSLTNFSFSVSTMYSEGDEYKERHNYVQRGAYLPVVLGNLSDSVT